MRFSGHSASGARAASSSKDSKGNKDEPTASKASSGARRDSGEAMAIKPSGGGRRGSSDGAASAHPSKRDSGEAMAIKPSGGGRRGTSDGAASAHPSKSSAATRSSGSKASGKSSSDGTSIAVPAASTKAEANKKDGTIIHGQTAGAKIAASMNPAAKALAAGDRRGSASSLFSSANSEKSPQKGDAKIQQSTRAASRMSQRKASASSLFSSHASSKEKEGTASPEGRKNSVADGRRNSLAASMRRASGSSLAQGQQGGGGRRMSVSGGPRMEMRRSSVDRDTDMAASMKAAVEDNLWSEPLDFMNICKCLRQVFIRCKRRCRAGRNEVAEAVSKEVQNSWGKTHTSVAVNGLRKSGCWGICAKLRKCCRCFRCCSRSSKMRRNSLTDAGGNWMRRATTMLRNDEKRQADIEEGFGVHRFVIHNPGRVGTFYEVGPEIKSGGTATIYRCTERATHVQRALKRVIKRDPLDFDRLLQEVAIMKQLDHPNIIKLFETFEDDRNLYMILELCEGGDIFDRLVNTDLTPTGQFSEYQASVIIRAVLMTLNYLHANGIVHRDIKPDNIAIKDRHHDIVTSSLRLIDFGYAVPLPDEKSKLSLRIGSPAYMAPEVLRNDYDARCDLWSTGVLAYTLLCGYPPFAGQTDSETISLVRKGKFIFHRSVWKDMSKPSKHLIRNLLEINPNERLTVQEALEHPWIKARGVVRIERMREETVDRLICFHTCHRLKRSAMLAVAYQLEAHDVRALLDLFQGLDLNGDGLLTREEFTTALQSICGVEEDYLEAMIQSVDADNSGVIDFTEFLASTLEPQMFITNHAALLRAFRCFDQNDSGGLSKDEVFETLCMNEEDDEEVDAFFEEVDLNQDGVMDYGEFHAMLEKVESMDIRENAISEALFSQGQEVDAEDEDEQDQGEYDMEDGWSSKVGASKSARSAKSMKSTWTGAESRKSWAEETDNSGDGFAEKSVRSNFSPRKSPRQSPGSRKSVTQGTEHSGDGLAVKSSRSAPQSSPSRESVTQGTEHSGDGLAVKSSRSKRTSSRGSSSSSGSSSASS